MDKHSFQQVCEQQLQGLDSIARRVGISDRLPSVPLLQTPFRALADALTLCPDESGAEKALLRHRDGWPGFAFFARRVGVHIANGQYVPEATTEGGTPYFYIGRFVASFVESLEDDARKRKAGEV